MDNSKRLTSLIAEGDVFLAKMDSIDAGQEGIRLHIEELRQWSDAAESWALDKSITLPIRGDRFVRTPPAGLQPRLIHPHGEA